MFSVLPTFLFINNRLQTAVCKQYITDLNSLLFWNQNFLWHCLWAHPFSIEITIIDMKSSHSLCISKKSWSVFVKKPNYNSEWVIVNSNIKSHKLETPSFYHTCFCYTHWYLRGVKNFHDNSLHSMKIWVISITLTKSIFFFSFLLLTNAGGHSTLWLWLPGKQRCKLQEFSLSYQTKQAVIQSSILWLFWLLWQVERKFGAWIHRESSQFGDLWATVMQRAEIPVSHRVCGLKFNLN